MEIYNYYGFKFFDSSNSIISQTYLPVGQCGLEELLIAAENYSHRLTFTPEFGVIKELLVANSEIKSHSPAKLGAEKNQAFIFKRPCDEITGSGEDYFLNGEKLKLGFGSYEVHVVETT
jgi:hypothetical protein